MGKRSKQTRNFSEWCQYHNQVEWLQHWNYDINEKVPEDCTTRETGDFYFWDKDKNYSFHIMLGTITHNRLSYDEVIKKSFLYALQQFSPSWQEIWSKNNVLSPAQLSPKTGNYKIKLCCKKHGEYITTPKQAYMANYKCPKCSKEEQSQRSHKVKRLCTNGIGSLLPKENLVTELPHVREFWGEENPFPPDDYNVNSNAVVMFKCDCGKHKDYPRKIYEAVMADFSCPKCNMERSWSRLQRKVYEYISSRFGEIKNERECTFIAKNPLTGYPMPYDNEIVQYGLLIEVQGIQHYKSYNYPNELNAEGGNTRAFRDKEKRQQAIQHGYSYLEIPFYCEYKDKWKAMIDEAVEHIRGGEQYF